MKNSSTDSPEPNWGQDFFNRILYDKLPGFYNAMDLLTFGAWWGLVRRALDYVPVGGHVLEVGFGPGRLLVELARRSEAAFGIDLAGGMCRFTHDRLAKQGLAPNITRGSMFRLPYPADSFESVVSTFALSGVTDVQGALKEMRRVAAPAGRVVVVDIALPEDGNRVGTFWARLWESMGDYLYDFPALMNAAGLTVTTCEEFGPGRHIRAVVGEKRAAQ
jgi:ubiquinone/menaquinone biosynthesis C-methylase UbiE